MVKMSKLESCRQRERQVERERFSSNFRLFLNSFLAKMLPSSSQSEFRQGPIRKQSERKKRRGGAAQSKLDNRKNGSNF